MDTPAPAVPEVNLVEALSETWKQRLRAKRSSGTTSERTYVYASGIRSCTRAMALDLTHPEDQAPFDDESLARMKRGDERELAIVAWLSQIGPFCSVPFKVIEGQKRFEIKDRDGTILLVGKVDCRLQFENGQKPFVEVKSGEGVRRVESIEDFDRSPWTRHYPDQLLSYLYAENQPWGLFVLDRPGLPKFIPVPLHEHWSRVERILGNVRRAVDVKLIDAPLPPFVEDRGECKRCPHWKKSCTPDMDFGAGVPVLGGLQGQLLADAAETMERTRAAHEQFEEAEEFTKQQLRGTEMALFGDFQAIGKWSRNTLYKVPEAVRAPYKEVIEQGKFTLKIERITGEPKP